MAGKGRAPGNADAVARILLLTRAQLEDHVRRGHLPPPVNGDYDPVKTTQAYIAWLQDRCAIPKVITGKELGEILGLSLVGVSKLVTDKGLPRIERGKYNALESIRWYIAFQRARVLYKQGNTDIEQENLMLKREQRKMAEMERKAKERLFVPADECRDGWTALVSMAGNYFQSLAGRLGHELTPEQREKVKHEARLAQEAMAAELRSLAEALPEPGGGDIDAGPSEDA